MTKEEKQVYMLLRTVIFSYHGLDEAEKKDLENTAEKLEATDELKWAMSFIAEDFVTAFERARAYLNDIIGDYPKKERINLINMVWEANNRKGYVTEMEATAMLKLAKDWSVEKELIALVIK